MKKNDFVNAQVRRLLVAIALLAPQAGLHAQDTLDVADSLTEESSAPATRSWLSGTVGISESYNDNILDYSARDLQQLETAPDSAKFAISRPFDGITSLRVRLAARPALYRRNPTLIQLRYSGNSFMRNSIRSYYTAGLEVKQTFLRKNYISAGFSILPEYYLRNLSYRDLSLTPSVWLKTAEARLQRRSYGVEVGRALTPRATVSAGYEYTQTDYNTELDERDNSTHRLELGGSIRISPVVRLRGAYSYAISWAKGREMSDTLTDISYWAHRIGLETLVSLKRNLGVPLSLSTGFTFEYQNYLSDKVYVFPARTFAERYGDKYHYGRFDRFYRVSAEATYEVIRGLGLSLQYSWEHNVANLEETLDAGTYQTHQVGFAVEYAF